MKNLKNGKHLYIFYVYPKPLCGEKKGRFIFARQSKEIKKDFTNKKIIYDYEKIY